MQQGSFSHIILETLKKNVCKLDTHVYQAELQHTSLKRQPRDMMAQMHTAYNSPDDGWLCLPTLYVIFHLSASCHTRRPLGMRVLSFEFKETYNMIPTCDWEHYRLDVDLE